MTRQILGGALAALLILSDRIAFALLAVALIGAVKMIAGAHAAGAVPNERAPAFVRVKL